MDATLTKKISNELFVRCNLNPDDDGSSGDLDDDEDLTEVDFTEFQELMARCAKVKFPKKAAEKALEEMLLNQLFPNVQMKK